MNVTLLRDLATEHWYSMERYANELARCLPQLECEVESFAPPRPFPNLGGTPNTLLNYAWRTFIYPRAARAHQGDVNHIVDHSYAHLIYALDARKTVVTCHDLAPLALNEGRGIARWLWDRSFRAMRRATRIIADSEFTCSEILRYVDYPAERIRVVPLAVSHEFFESVRESDLRARREQYHLNSRRVFLHVGSCEPRKNVELILNALKELDDLDIVFVQVGGRFTPYQRTLVQSLGLTERVIQIAPTFGHDLAAWYKIANLFVFPSHYEGFGIPVVEAMASGVPVVCARSSSLPEVAGDAALLVDPNDCAQLVRAIRSVLSDSSLEEDLIARGQARAKMFTWERTARETLAVYREIA